MKVVGILLDLSSAFDTVNHNLLLLKLEHYGVRGKVLEFFSSYFKNRNMYVEIKAIDVNKCQNAYQSQMFRVNTGVPQGSILGPILFIIFTNDLINYAAHKNPDDDLVLFADDTNAVVSASDINLLNTKVNKTLDMFQEWFTANKLIVNSKKTNIILFQTTARGTDTLNIKFNGDKINLVSSAKFLGVHIDAHLNWKKELDAIDASISSSCYALRSLRDEVDIKILKTVYFALVESRLRCSIQFWGNSYQYNCNRAFILQKRAIRIIVRIPQWESCREYFKELAILTVPSLYILIVLSNLSKNIHRFETADERKLRISTRRNALKTALLPTLNVVKHGASYQAVKLFNCLPIELKNDIYKTHLFKTKLKTFLINNCFYSLEEFIAMSNNI